MNRFEFKTFRFGKLFRISIFVLSASIVAAQPAFAATITASLKPAFQADLTNTLKLQAGSGNPTFTRATTVYEIE